MNENQRWHNGELTLKKTSRLAVSKPQPAKVACWLFLKNILLENIHADSFMPYVLSMAVFSRWQNWEVAS